MLRTDKFTGKVGEYSTVFNILVRELGKKQAIKFKSDKKYYKKFCKLINISSQEYFYQNKKSVMHPNWKVDAFYGMKKELREELKLKNLEKVFAYKTTWLVDFIKNSF